MTVGAIVLAAGRATRGPGKLVADLGGRPVVTHVVEAVALAGLPPPIVVVGHRADAVRAALAGCDVRFIVATDYADGLSASLRAGLVGAPEAWRAALVLLGDMPRVGPATLRALVAVATDTVIAVPVWGGRRGNPVLWGRAHFAALQQLTGDTGGRSLLAGHRVVEIAADSDSVLIDVDTPEALAALRG